MPAAVRPMPARRLTREHPPATRARPRRMAAGPSPGFSIWQAPGGTWSRGVHLGDEVWPQFDGFVALSTSYGGQPPPAYGFFDGAGNQHASVPQGNGRMLVSPRAHVLVQLQPD